MWVGYLWVIYLGVRNSLTNVNDSLVQLMYYFFTPMLFSSVPSSLLPKSHLPSIPTHKSYVGEFSDLQTVAIKLMIIVFGVGMCEQNNKLQQRKLGSGV